jgi:hypothetical protein
MAHVTGKVKGVPVFLTGHHAMEAYWGSGGITPVILAGCCLKGKVTTGIT